MPRPRRTDPPVRLEISLPQSVHAKIATMLYSPAERAIPMGAWSAFFETLARQAIARTQENPNANQP